MSFWDAYSEPTELPDPYSTNKIEPERKNYSDYPGIYQNSKGKFLVYVTTLGTKHYVGTFNTLNEAIEARIEFKETGQKQLKQTARLLTLEESLAKLIEEQA
jgi:hypothetical protein